ncbi:MAG: hypothetical protein ACLT5F_05930 [Anaerotignaceae bacterium]
MLLGHLSQDETLHRNTEQKQHC